ncbi:hypothetical protein APHAL10511_001119 [Amanita phalloides]|nr:hypothetical protein APHAL10511_001119 [Amanita phalloides]
MPLWYSSWLPGLPSVNFAVPSSLQGRFVSFVLKKCLGHFLKPGQLDARQIESQIGSGFVQINDLELNNEAINPFLAGLPLVLHDGYISSVTARVPWPNPLASNLGLSLDALRLTFHVIPNVSTPSQGADLTESVASAAETFMHEELTEKDGATLLNSTHLEVPQDVEAVIPGGLDLFAKSEEEIARIEDDPQGVSLFTSLVEKLLARFEFKALNTEITVVHPGNMSLTLSIAEVLYGPEANADANQSSKEDNRQALSISGIRIATRDLRPRNAELSINQSSPIESIQHPRLYQATRDDYPTSPAGSSSSLDEETREFMSQSLVSLPPRSDSLLGSASSSLYQSAFSEESSRQHPLKSSAEPPIRDSSASSIDEVDLLKSGGEEVGQEDKPDDTLLSFGSVPLVMYFQAPLSSDIDEGKASNGDDLLKVSVSMGTVGLACNARQLAGIATIVGCFDMKHTAPYAKAESTSSAPRTLNCKVDVKVGGLVVLVLPNHSTESRSLLDFFAHPLALPRLSSGYVRFYVGDIRVAIVSNKVRQIRKKNQSDTFSESKLEYGLRCTDLNASIHSFSSSMSEMLVHPIVLTDRYLRSQYVPPRVRPRSVGGSMPLPTFTISDRWAMKHQGMEVDLSPWQFKPQPDNASGDVGAVVEETPPPQFSEEPITILLKGERITAVENGKQAQLKDEVLVDILPLHLFLDIEQLSNVHVVKFLQEFLDDVDKGNTSDESSGDVTTIVDDDQANTPPATIVRPFSEGQHGSKRQEGLILKNWNIHSGSNEQARTSLKQRHTRNHAQTSFSITFMMIRIELRCSPLSHRSTSQSGTVVIDSQHLKFSSGDRSDQRSARFTTSSIQPHFDSSSSAPTVQAQCNGVLVALCLPCETTANVIALVTSLDEFSDAMDNNFQARTPLKPRASISKLVGSVSMTMLDINVPSIYTNLAKEALDGLLVWADNATQLIERATGLWRTESARNFTLSRRDVTHGNVSKTSPLRVNASVTEGCPIAYSSRCRAKFSWILVMVRLLISSSDVIHSERRPFDVSASDLVLSIEMNPDSMEHTVVEIEAMDLLVANMSLTNELRTILEVTTPRNFSTLSKPPLKSSIISLVTPESGAKETRLTFVLYGVTGNILSDTQWLNDLNLFIKSPPGVFESVVPSEKTSISLRLQDSSIRAFAPTLPGALLLHVGDMEFMTDIIGNAREDTFHLLVHNLSLLTVDDLSCCEDTSVHQSSSVSYWKNCGYALVAEVVDTVLQSDTIAETPDTRIVVEKITLRVHLCADTLTAVLSIINDWQQKLNPNKDVPIRRTEPAMVSKRHSPESSMMSSVEDFALQRPPEIGPAPDMISDDLPTNMVYLDESFGAAAGLRELCDEDLDDFDNGHGPEVDPASLATEQSGTGVISRVGGETVKMIRPEGVQIIENFFESLADTSDAPQRFSDTTLRIRAHHCKLTLLLYEGYDWVKTRQTIEREVKDMRRRLARIRQLVANGQTPDFGTEEMSTILFNSVCIGLDNDTDGLEPSALIAAIDEQLNDDIETASQSSWQSLRPRASERPKSKPIRIHGKRLTRSKGPSMEFILSGANVEVDRYDPSDALVSRTFVAIKDVEILDHIKTSSWRKFLTALQLDSRGNTRETDSNMVRLELQNIRPVPGLAAEEVRLRAKILPLRLYVDQDAVDFLKKFFSFNDPNVKSSDTEGSSDGETFIQFAEIFPVVLKLDYKPRRVDYKALREGRTIELMNFFHFDGAEMTLRHITLSGITGWPRLFELLNDLWTPDVKATQLVDVISGVSPIRSVVNVGSGVADLVLLPIAQYKKDGRILRGLQKGTTAFFKSTALEAIKLGAKLATGTQVILEQAEGVLGGQFQQSVTTEAIQEEDLLMGGDISDYEGPSDVISRYADQPRDIKEGMHSAYKSLRRNFSSAAQTILAVPMEVYERSGDEGAIRSVIRAVPIAVLKPMIGATEAVSKTLLGLHNTLDSNVRHDNQAKYKQR